MSTSKYHAFVVTAELRNITRAAGKLGYTQSGVSHLISALEADLGVPLLIRSKSGTVLTPEGAALLPYAQRLLKLEEDIRNKAIDLQGLTAGSLRIGTFSSVAIHLFPRILSRFRDRYPGVEVSVLNGDYAAVENALLDNSIDGGFVTLPSREEFTVFPLVRDRLLAVVDDENPLGQAADLEPRDLKDQTFIVPAVVMVRRKLGVTILPELMVRNLPMEGLRAIPLRGSEREIGFATHRSRYLSPAVRAFLDCTRATVEEL